MRTVLIVDDSSFITEGLASIMRKNYRTIVASGGEMCLQILKKETPDIIILDILMEPIDGWETLLRIRENPITRHIPIIMFSAKKISPFEAETHHPHIDEYITKPVSPRDLLDTVARVLSRKEMSQKTMQLWRQAGLAADEIEEYVRLVTSIEVERGLCSNMEQQILTGRRDAPVEEIQKSIAAIRERIERESEIAGDISRRGDALVASCGGPDAFPTTVAIDPVTFRSPDPAVEAENRAPAPFTEKPRPAQDAVTLRHTIDRQETQGPGLQTPTLQGASGEERRGVALTGSTLIAGEQESPVHSTVSETRAAPLPSIPKSAGSEDRAVFTVPEPKKTAYSNAIESLLEDVPQPKSSAGHDAGGPVSPVQVAQPAAPVFSQQREERTPPSSGTHVAARSSGNSYNPPPPARPVAQTRPPLQKKPAAASAKKTPPAQGFFARLIQAILGIFSRSKR